jgi:hypothetical protein
MLVSRKSIREKSVDWCFIRSDCRVKVKYEKYAGKRQGREWVMDNLVAGKKTCIPYSSLLSFYPLFIDQLCMPDRFYEVSA